MRHTPEYIETTCKSALHKIGTSLPFNHDLNIYRGCFHSCVYCFAHYSHEYLGDNDFDNHIYVKTNIAERLEMTLSRPSWGREIINLGGITDSYQPAEAAYKMMPDIWKLLIKYRTPAIISTKSVLILRDFDLIAELSKIAYVSIAATITTMDEDLRQLIEPNTPKSSKRFEMLSEFKKTNATVGLHMMPIIPYLTDSSVNINSLFANAKNVGVDYFIPSILNLKGQTRGVFLKFMKEKFPQFHDKILELYTNKELRGEYKKSFYEMLYDFKDKYNLSKNYSKAIDDKVANIKNIF